MPRRVALPAPDALVHPIYARLLRMLLQQEHVDADRVLAAARLDWSTLLADDRRLSRDTITRLVGAAVSASGRPWLGLELGSQAPMSAHGALGYAAVTARDLRGSLEVVARYASMQNDALAWSLHATPEGASVQAVDLADWGPARGFVNDVVVAVVLRMIGAALGHWPAGIVVDMPLPRPPWSSRYERFSPVGFRFGQPALAFHVDRAALVLPCLGSDARAHAAACHECEAVLADMAGRSLAQRVGSLIADAPAGRLPGLADAASACGCSPRTLIRRLQADGTSFQALLDGVRRQRALWLLQHTPSSVEEIAAQLGYADTSNFSRTVRRWFGATPRELRRRGMPGRPGADDRAPT